MTNEETPAASVAEHGAPVAPTKAASKNGATSKKGAPKAQKPAKGAKPKKDAKPKRQPKSVKEAGPRSGKGAKVLEMIGRGNGATLADLMKATEWQAHSIRGFLSTASKKHNVTIDSSKNDKGERVYLIAK